MKKHAMIAAALAVFGFAAPAVASPARISPLASVYLGYGQAGFRAAASGPYVYTVNASRLTVFDVSNPASPTMVAALGAGGRDVVAWGRFVFAGDANQLNVIDVSTPTAPVLLSTVAGAGGNKMAISAHYLFAAAPGALRVVDISTPGAPTVVGTLALTADPTFIATYGNYALVTVGSALVVADISNPAQPRQVTSVSFPNTAYGVAVSGNLAYVTTHGTYCDTEACTLTNGALYVIDVTMPPCPKILSSVATLKAAEDIAVGGQYAYIVEQSVDFYPGHTDFLVVDVSNPAAPQLAAYYQSNVLNATSQGLAVGGNYVFEAITTGANVFTPLGSTDSTIVPMCTAN